MIMQVWPAPTTKEDTTNKKKTPKMILPMHAPAAAPLRGRCTTAADAASRSTALAGRGIPPKEHHEMNNIRK